MKMDTRLAIHTAARRYCVERQQSWRERQRDETSDSIWPRIEALGTILLEVERFSPEDFASLAHARRTMILTAHSVQFEFDKSFTHSDQSDAAEEERELFTCFLSLLAMDDLEAVEPMPFRRVLMKMENTKLWERLTDIWGRWSGGVAERDSGRSEMTLRADAFASDDNFARLTKILCNHHRHRLWELRDLSDGFELELELFRPEFNTGGEGFWIDDTLEWMIYASRCNTLTLGGDWLVDFARLEFRKWRDWTLPKASL
jgi:hypothetical protein